MNCKDCWQRDVCNPPDETKNIGCQFYSVTRPTELDATNKVLDDMFEDLFDGIDHNEPVDSCEMCGINIYADEDDGSGLCDQCASSVYESNGGKR